MNENRAITYSLLAHIRNTGTLIQGPIDPFVPLIKRSLYKLNSKGILSGKSIKEIHDVSNELYGIDFPLPVLKVILQQIANEVNTIEDINFQLYNDGAFSLKNFFFEEFEENIQSSKREVESLEKLYIDFLKLNNLEVKEKSTILDFIDKNKISISKYLANNQPLNGKDYTIEAQFVEFFRKIPDVYDIIKNIYLGSIISSYLECKTENNNQEVELVFDTNFIISLIDLNTPESTHSCNKLMNVCRDLGYKFTVLKETIEETKYLISKKAEHYSTSVLSKRINPEDIYNACERRKLSRNDLERIVDNIEDSLLQRDILILPNTDKYRNLAKFSKEYEGYKKFRSSHYAALHDATALYYVRDKRTKKIKEFEKVNCWFVNNSISHDSEDLKDLRSNSNDSQPEIIRADELLNILWLANPNLSKSINSNELVEIGLSSLVAFTLNSTLPKASIIKELDENIQKYGGDKITDKDVLLISSRISHRQLTDISALNSLAKVNEQEFANRIKQEADKQAQEENQRIQKLDQLFKKFEKQISNLDKARQELKEKKDKLEIETKITQQTTTSKDQQINELQVRLDKIEQERQRDIKILLIRDRKYYINQQLARWRQRTNYELIGWLVGFVFSITALLWNSNWKIDSAIIKYRKLESDFIVGNIIVALIFIFTAITFKKWYDKNHNFSNIENYKKSIEFPEHLKKDE
ncbi:hypothetical protein LZF95_08505 [Algoriphagus sp. AGSA1]|uniref:hypothetical protein n=1 Tax=Algoriphagus sp. AGSA1 TaxID=2907213 RepID=UPI001F31AC5F|nr:hypothetical protein [Algoriphagus sp. AGSA1]MCE7054711.1 hypothetical protein [Algoriphagus sp. AGSA1]